MLLADLLQLLEPGPALQTRHEQELQRREEELRRQDAENHEAVAVAAAAPRPSELMLQAEREMAPGSHAARQEQLRGQAQECVRQDRRGFRQVLAETTGGEAGERTSCAEPEPTEPPQRNRPEAARSNTAGAGKTSQPSGSHVAASTGEAAAGRPATAGTLFGAASSLRVSPFTAPLAVSTPESNLTDLSKSGPVALKVITAPGAGAGSAANAQAGSGGGREVNGAVVAIEAGQPTALARKSAGGAGAGAELEPTGNSDANIERVLRLIHTRIGKERSVATLRLDPPELGTIRLRMELRKHELSLAVETQTVAAQRLLAEHIDTLRRSLEASGIHLDRVELRTATTNETPDASAPQQPDVPAREYGGAPHRDGESAGGGSHGGTDSRPEGTTEVGRAAPALTGPATESLVNVLA